MRVLTAYFVGHKSNRLTALKTMSLRLTTTKAKLQEMGEETEYACETLSSYRDLILGLTANTSAPVDIFDASGQYKGTTQAMRELSKVVDELDTKQLSALTYALFGQRQSNVGLSLLKNFKDTEDAIKAAQTASEGIGSAMEEQNRWAESLEAKINDVTVAAQVLSTDIFDTDTIKAVVTAMGDLIIKFDDLVKKIDVSKMLMGVFVAWAAKVKNAFTASFTDAGVQVNILNKSLTLFRTNTQSVNNQLSITTSSAQAVTKTMTEYNATLGQSSRLQTMLATTIPTTSVRQYLASLNGAEASLQGYCTWLAQSAMVQEDANIVIERYNSLQAFGANAQSIFRAEVAKTNPVMAQYLTNTGSATASIQGYNAAQRSATLTTNALTIATGLLKTAMFSLVTIGVSVFFQWISNTIQKHDELIKKVSETASAFDTEKKNLAELKQQYIDLVNSTETEAEKEDKLKEIKKQLVEQYGLEADQIAKINELREEGIEIFDDYTQREIANTSAEMEQGFKNAIDDIKYYTKSVVGDYNGGIFGNDFIDNENIRKEIQDLFDYTSKEIQNGSNTITRDVLGFEEENALAAYDRLHEIITSMQEVRLSNGEFTEDEQRVFDELSERYEKLTKKFGDAYEAARRASALNAEYIYQDFVKTADAFDKVYGTDEYEQWYADLVEETRKRVGEEQLPYLEWAYKQMFDGFKTTIASMKNEVVELEDPFAKIKALVLSVKQSLSELDGETDKSAKSLDELVKIISDNKDKDKFFSSKDIIEYLDKYPDLVNAIEQTAYGYKLNEEALESLRAKTVEEKKETLQAELDKSKETLKEAKRRIEIYQAEIAAKEALAKTATNTVDRNKYFSDANVLKKNLKDATGEFDNTQKVINKIQRQIDILGTQFDDIKDTTTETNSILSKQKDILKDESDQLKKDQEYINDLLKLTIDYLKKEAENQKSNIKDRIDGLKKAIDLKKEELDLLKDQRDFEAGLNEKNKTVTDLQKKIEDLSIEGVDYSLDDLKKRKEYEEEYAKAKLDLEDYLFDNDIKNRKDALDKEASMQEEAANEEIKAIDDLLSKEGLLRQKAIELINGKSQEFYKDLLNYTVTYTEKSDYEFNKLWNNAYAALEKYGNGQIDVVGVLAYLDGQLVYTDELVKQLEADMQKQSNSTINAINAERWALEDFNDELEKSNELLDGANEKIYAWEKTGKYTMANKPNHAYWSVPSMSDLMNLPKFHSGGVVEGKGEVFAKLMGGEVVSTEKQAETFLSKTLPNLIGTGTRVANNSNVSFTLGDMVINGNADQSTVNSLNNLKNQIVDSIFNRINAQLRKTGVKLAY